MDGRLHSLCREGKLKQIEEFITLVSDFHLRLANRRGWHGYTPLHEAVNKGHSIVVQLLLDHNGDLDCRANNGYTPLHLAASKGHVDCVRVLLRNNADICKTDLKGRTPIEVAVLNSRHAVLKILRSAG